MKRKFIVLLSVGALVFSLFSASAVFAEAETEVPSEITSLSWDDFENDVVSDETLAGDFYEFENIALKMYLPASFQTAQLTEEDFSEGYCAYFLLGEDAAVAVDYIDMGGIDLAEYAAILTENFGVTDATPVCINGLEMLSYTHPEDKNVAVLTLATEQGYIMEFSFSPITDETFAAIALVMMASIQEA